MFRPLVRAGTQWGNPDESAHCARRHSIAALAGAIFPQYDLSVSLWAVDWAGFHGQIPGDFHLHWTGRGLFCDSATAVDGDLFLLRWLSFVGPCGGDCAVLHGGARCILGPGNFVQLGLHPDWPEPRRSDHALVQSGAIRAALGSIHRTWFGGGGAFSGQLLQEWHPAAQSGDDHFLLVAGLFGPWK